MKNKTSLFISAFFTGAILIYAAARFMISDIPPGKVLIRSSTGKVDEELRSFLTKNVKTPGKIPTELLEQFPSIEHASVKNYQNGTIEVKIKYKKIVGIWEQNGIYYPLLENGTHINRPFQKKPERGIVFRGMLPNNIGALIRILPGYPELVKKIEYLEYVEGRRWNIILSGGAVVMLPEKNEAAAIAEMKKLNVLNKSFASIDLRDPYRALVR